MDFSLLTYNVLFNKACADLREVFKVSPPDIICLQEIETEEANLAEIEKLGYKLADYSNSFIKFGKIYGVATFYNPQKIRLIKTGFVNLPRSVIEFILTVFRVLRGGNKPRTMLTTGFVHIETNKRFSVYNTHLTPYSSNRTRIKAINLTFNSGNGDQSPLIMAGDFNYFYGRRALDEFINANNLKEATTNILYSFERQAWKYSIIQRVGAFIFDRLFPNFAKRYKFDYILYRDLICLETKRINLHYSDHYPIISSFKFT